MHRYGLLWIDEEALFQVTRNTFKNAILKKDALPLDPFSTIAQAEIFDCSVDDVITFDEMRAKNKSLSNAIGLWHQRVLGLSPHFEELGASGGVVDLKSVSGFVHPVYRKPLYLEVKNRFNTIKSSDEKIVWDKLDEIARCNAAISYLVQIVPASPDAYDKPWEPSGRKPKDFVRVCDGVTAYALAFDRDDALYRVFHALPGILADVIVDYGLAVPHALCEVDLDGVFNAVMPSAPKN
ncbi:Eco47II family restriction endonuclease [Collinsella sp. D33t1_170424_A12]|uniref:Eco47II family restriction endonuclease n=1 Tax=Collinsella sp. D33t1_170424_A12 TaxID=2787135 RepID=UPI00189BEDC9|nr:Eco47II family restriction endonuclease [Collinsella sp. D33t1_170424_A12]